MAGVARDFTLLDVPHPDRTGALIVPVVGGDVLVQAGGWSTELEAAEPGTRLTARIVDSGPGWWLASAARPG